MTIQEAIESFLNHIRASQSLGTSRTYATGLGHLSRYLSSLGIAPEQADVSALSLSVVTGFITWLYDYLLEHVAGGDPHRVSESTKSVYYAAVSRFLSYLVIETQQLHMTLDEYDVLRKALARASKAKTRGELPPDKLPTAEIVEALLAEARRPRELGQDASPEERRRHELARLRNIAIVEALVSSGMRVSELVRLRRGDLLHAVRGALVRYTKGKKEREVLFSERAWAAIQNYLSERRDGETARRALADLPVFARHDRRASDKALPLSTRSVENILFGLATSAGILEKFRLTPHTLRHFFATEFLSATGDLALTQYALGHSSPNTTRIYAQTKREDYRRAHRKVFGGGNL